MPETAAELGDLRAWLERSFDQVERLAPLQGDVSLRRYVRVIFARRGNAIAALYPPKLAGALHNFLATTVLFASHRLPVPAVLAVDLEQRFMLVEDVGERSLFVLPPDHPDRERLLRSACEHAATIRHLPVSSVRGLNPPLDRTLLEQEVELTWRLFLEPRGLVGSPPASVELEHRLANLCAELAAADPVPCHRDYMSRNLMLKDDGLVILDHQDLRLGPPTYDLASLLNDSLQRSPELEATLLGEFVSGRERETYHRAAVQRCLKIVGTFTRFAAAGSPRYLSLVPVTLARALEHMAQVPETEAMCDWLGSLWAPHLPDR